jgi:hypothetical protein
MKADADGLHGSQDNDGGWRASKFYGGNVVLSWSADRRATDETFNRMHTILSTLGQPAAAVRAKLPAAEQPCQVRGITLAGRTEGTCRDGDVTLTVVNRGHKLKLPGYTVKVLLTKSGDLIKPDNPYEPIMQARGKFIGVGLQVSNTGSTPLVSRLYDAQLRIGDRYYEQDSAVGFRLSDPDTFPRSPATAARRCSSSTCRPAPRARRQPGRDRPAGRA